MLIRGSQDDNKKVMLCNGGGALQNLSMEYFVNQDSVGVFNSVVPVAVKFVFFISDSDHITK